MIKFINRYPLTIGIILGSGAVTFSVLSFIFLYKIKTTGSFAEVISALATIALGFATVVITVIANNKANQSEKEKNVLQQKLIDFEVNKTKPYFSYKVNPFIEHVDSPTVSLKNVGVGPAFNVEIIDIDWSKNVVPIVNPHYSDVVDALGIGESIQLDYLVLAKPNEQIWFYIEYRYNDTHKNNEKEIIKSYYKYNGSKLIFEFSVRPEPKHK